MSFRMQLEPQNALASVMMPVIRPLFARQLQQDLDDFAKAAAALQQGDQQRQEEGVSRLWLGLSGGIFVVGAIILALYLLLRQRSGASRRRWGSSAR